MRRRWLGLITAVCLAGSPWGSVGSARVTDTAPRLEAGTLGAYRGLGTWVDIYDRSPYRWPGATIERMAEEGVSTLYLETANYRIRRAIHRPGRVSELLEAAHARDMRVVAWYLPSFANLKRDFRRARVAIEFESENGERFDSFALDIEATEVADMATRNRRARRLARRLRESVGSAYPMGAIVPEAGALYWPGFPYRAMDRHFDVFLPMAYFTYRTSGYDGVYGFVSKNVRAIREGTGDPNVPIHMIGGIAPEPAEVRAFTRAALDRHVMGAGLYDFKTTAPTDWDVLGKLAPL